MKINNLILVILLLKFAAVDIHAQKGKDVIIQKSFENGNLFFIMPQELQSDNRKMEFEADFTVNYQKDSANPEKVQMNFTIFSEEPVKELTSLMVVVNGKEIGVVRNFNKFYLEKKGRSTWAARFGASLTYEQLLAFLNPAEDTRLVIKTGKEKFSLAPDSKIKKEYEVAFQTLSYHFE